MTLSPYNSNSSSSNNNNVMPDRDFNYQPADPSERAVAKGGVSCPFPWRLHEMLKVSEAEGLQHIVSWCPHGRAFAVHKPNEFADQLMKRFFCQTKYASFQRQLNLYGFQRFTTGRDKGAYWNAAFVRNQRALVRRMIRRKVKGADAATARLLPSQEPDFYKNARVMEHTVTATASWEPLPAWNHHHDHSHDESSSSMEAGQASQASPRVMRPPGLGREVSVDGDSTRSSKISDTPVAFFEGSPFHCIDDNNQQIENSPVTIPRIFDPAAELEKLRAQIRRKQAEYEETVVAARRRVSRQSSSSSLAKHVSFQQDELTDMDEEEADDSAVDQVEQMVAQVEEQQQQRKQKQQQAGSSMAVIPHFVGIPVYKGSYIAV